MAQGILYKGFTIKTPMLQVKIRKNTKVYMHHSVPSVRFDGIDAVEMFRFKEEWFVRLWDKVHLVLFDHEKPPYPISYFK